MINPKDVGTKYCIIRILQEVRICRWLFFRDGVEKYGTLWVTSTKNILWQELSFAQHFGHLINSKNVECLQAFALNMCHERVGTVVRQSPQIVNNDLRFLFQSRYTSLKEAVQVAQLPCFCIGLDTSYMPLLHYQTLGISDAPSTLHLYSTSRNHDGINILGLLHLGQFWPLPRWHHHLWSFFFTWI